MPSWLFMGDCLGIERQAQCEYCSHTDFALNFQCAVVPLHDLLADREPQPRAARLVFVFAHAKKLFEKVRQGILRNAYARILHGDRDLGVISFGLDDHGTVAMVVLDGIAQQVENDLLDLVTVRFDQRQGLG